MVTKKQMLLISLLSKGSFSVIFAALLLFASAGSFQFMGAWVFLFIIITCSIAFGTWLYSSHPQQFENRFHEEKTAVQQKIVFYIGIVLIVTLILSGLDFRFDWSQATVWRYCFAIPLLVCGLMIYVKVFELNPFLLNTIEVQNRQRVIKSGLYGIIRHPMYLGTIYIYIACLFILGSWMNVLSLLLFMYLISVRIKLEEEQLLNELLDYDDYCRHVKYKLFLFIW